MAEVIDFGSRRPMLLVQRPAYHGDAKILIFNGVRFERLEVTGEAADIETTAAYQHPADPTLRNRAG
jgi:hypothetical protein